MDRLIRVAIDWPADLPRQALEAAWWDGARTGFVIGVLLVLLVWLVSTRGNRT